MTAQGLPPTSGDLPPRFPVDMQQQQQQQQQQRQDQLPQSYPQLALSISDVLRKELISLNDASKLGQIVAPLVDTQQQKVVGLAVRQANSLLRVAFDEVQEIGDVILAQGNFIGQNMWDNPALSDPRLEDPLGVPVCFPNGAMVGVVRDIVFDPETGSITHYLFQNGTRFSFVPLDWYIFDLQRVPAQLVRCVAGRLLLSPEGFYRTTTVRQARNKGNSVLDFLSSVFGTVDESWAANVSINNLPGGAPGQDWEAYYRATQNYAMGKPQTETANSWQATPDRYPPQEGSPSFSSFSGPDLSSQWNPDTRKVAQESHWMAEQYPAQSYPAQQYTPYRGQAGPDKFASNAGSPTGNQPRDYEQQQYGGQPPPDSAPGRQGAQGTPEEWGGPPNGVASGQVQWREDGGQWVPMRPSLADVRREQARVVRGGPGWRDAVRREQATSTLENGMPQQGIVAGGGRSAREEGNGTQMRSSNNGVVYGVGVGAESRGGDAPAADGVDGGDQVEVVEVPGRRRRKQRASNRKVAFAEVVDTREMQPDMAELIQPRLLDGPEALAEPKFGN